jgi:hypothetical protein
MNAAVTVPLLTVAYRDTEREPVKPGTVTGVLLTGKPVAVVTVFHALAEQRRNWQNLLAARAAMVERNVGHRAVTGAATPRRQAVVSLRSWREAMFRSDPG